MFFPFSQKAFSASIVKEVELALGSVVFMSFPASSSTFQTGKLAILVVGKGSLFILMKEYVPKAKRKLAKTKGVCSFLLKRKFQLLLLTKNRCLKFIVISV